MTDLQGSVGLVQLSKLDGLIVERQRWADYYSRELSAIRWLRCPVVPSDYAHAWQAYVCYVDPQVAPMPRNDVMDALQVGGINTRPGTHAVHMLGYYAKRFGLAEQDFPVSRDCDRQTMAIPFHNRMEGEDFAYVVQTLKELR
jgi:dTDP-4-amino-4,6-dideoxygalactose transaminase